MGIGRVLTWKYVIRDSDGYTLCADPRASGYAYYWSQIDMMACSPSCSTIGHKRKATSMPCVTTSRATSDGANVGSKDRSLIYKGKN